MEPKLDNLTEWIGQKETAVDYVTIPAVHRLSAALDRDDPTPKVGDALPLGWHSILFPRIVRASQVGTDGHPARGDFLPPVPLPRRMFAGKRITFHSALKVGDEVHRESTIQSVTPKTGRTGQMVFVTVKTDISGPGGLAITEEQDIVYRGEPDPKAPPPAPQGAPGQAVWSHSITPDPVLLFRYSALTFNGHRIHYDYPYVTKVEGYPDLVMNGGLTTLLVFELARTHASTPLRYMASRNVRPLFVNREIRICGEPSTDNKTANLWALDDKGALALSAEAEFRVMAGGPLEGIRIVDLTSVVVGPLATQILADHGAEVIKVEAPSGDLGRTIGGLGVTPGMGPKFLHLNRNKRSLVLDLKKPAGRQALMRLLERADVLVWNVRPASMERMKLGYDDVRAVNPKIIYCGMFGFGQGGRYREKPAYDSIIQGSSGVAALYHRAAGEPRYLPMVMADKTCGLIAVQMVLMALFHRERTGEGQAIEIPMFENMAAFVLSEHMYMKSYEPPRGTTGDPRLLDPQAKPLVTKDGFVCVSANTQAQAFALFDAIGRPELKTDPRFSTIPARFRNVGEYFRIRAEALKEKTTAEWLEIFDERDVPAMPYHTLDTLMEDPHLKEVDFFETVDHPTEGKIVNMALPNKLSGGVRRDFSPAPKIGQHSVEILRELGYPEADIQEMVAGKVTIDGRLAQQE